jgi:hypothetical protein
VLLLLLLPVAGAGEATALQLAALWPLWQLSWRAGARHGCGMAVGDQEYKSSSARTVYGCYASRHEVVLKGRVIFVLVGYW